MTLFRNMDRGGYRRYRKIPSYTKQDSKNMVLGGKDDLLPRTVNNKANALSFGGCEFDIKRTIYPTANIEQIFDGWNSLVAAKIPMDLLYLCLVLEERSYDNDDNAFTVRDYNNYKCNILDQKKSTKGEPEPIALLRLCYWYHRCLQINDRMQDNYFNFNDKLKEIKEELGQKTKAKARSCGLPILADYGSNIINYYAQLQSLITDTIRKGNIRNKAFCGTFHDIRYSIYRFLSECMFYTLVSEAGFKVIYCKAHSIEAPGLVVGCVPSAFGILLGEEICEYNRLKTITKADDLNDEILHILQLNRRLVQRINEALKEGLLVILDTTGTLLGDVINLYN